MEQYGERSNLFELINAGFKRLNLVKFFSGKVNGDLRSVAVREGTKVSKAGGVINPDIEKGFQRAYVMKWADLKKHGAVTGSVTSYNMKNVDKDYEVKDGDIITFEHDLKAKKREDQMKFEAAKRWEKLKKRLSRQ